jgi:hypothetical protein
MKTKRVLMKCLKGLEFTIRMHSDEIITMLIKVNDFNNIYFYKEICIIYWILVYSFTNGVSKEKF